MVSSLDFFIAKKDGSVSWMETSDSYEKGVDGVTAEGAEEFLRTIDCYVMGSSTYELALEARMALWRHTNNCNEP
jgi:dihydrofolate reductase